MLGRTASSLYWMSRYMERAENMARLLEVGYRISLMPGAIEGHRDEWRSTLQSCACDHGYAQKHDEIATAKVIDFLIFDEDNPSSIRSCIKTARNNGRAVRTALTRDVWESINATWNELAQVKPSSMTADRLPVFLEWVKQRVMSFRGALLGTMLRNDTYHFSQLGNFIERADNTARILDVKYHTLLPSVDEVGGAVDYYQWGSLLRSVGTFESYRKIYRDVITPFRVGELLILRDDVPRSLHACMNDIYEILQKLSDAERREPERLAGEIHAQLHYGKPEQVFEFGLHEYLMKFLVKIEALNAEIDQHFLVPDYS